MNNKQKELLKKLFENPVQSGIAWRDIEGLLKALGAEIPEGRGSRVRLVLNDIRAVFHRPHPRKEADKGSIISMRRFLAEAEINDDEL